jgi:hypothetical protein
LRNKKREYLEEKIDELPTNRMNKNIRDLYRGINDFKRGYQPRSNLVMDENGDLLADFHNILNRWKNFSQLLTVHGGSDVRQIEIHIAEPLVPDPNALEVDIAIANLERYKSPGCDQILAELLHGGGEILRSKIHKVINNIWNKNCLINGSNPLLYQFTRRTIKLTVVLIVGYHCFQLRTKFYPIFCCMPVVRV